MSASAQLHFGSPPTLRRAQTLQELERFSQELADWREWRTDHDERGQYKSQLTAIVNEVAGALDMIRKRVSDLGAGGAAAGELYTRLARLDRQLIWVRYAWDFFRSRFDQRDDPQLGRALKAADEVCWSCFKPAFQGASKRPTAPLPCIDLDYSPSTLLSTNAHRLDRLERIDNLALAAFFKELPVPILGLPPTIVTSPWMLALVAHESGHSVMNDVDTPEPDSFADRVMQAVQRAGGVEEDEVRWESWSPELFADWYALLMMGPAAAWALAQLEFGEAAQMTVTREKYPPARIRLLVLARMASQLGFSSADSILVPFGIDASQLAAIAASGTDGKIAESVAMLVRPVEKTAPARLAAQVGFRASDFEVKEAGLTAPVDKWAQVLRKTIHRPVENDIRTARLVTAGAVKAALEIQSADGALMDEELEDLRSASLDLMAASSEKGTRGAVAEIRSEHVPLARRLLEIPDEELFGGAPP